MSVEASQLSEDSNSATYLPRLRIIPCPSFFRRSVSAYCITFLSGNITFIVKDLRFIKKKPQSTRCLHPPNRHPVGPRDNLPG